MRDYAKVSPKFWIGQTGKALRGDANAQLVALYLMTCPHANMIGVFHCPVLYISHETGIPFEGASEALRRLSEGGFCSCDSAMDMIFVHRMAAFQVAEQLQAKDNQVKAIAREWEAIGSPLLRRRFFEIYSKAYHLPSDGNTGVSKPEDDKPLQSPSKAPSEPLRSQEQEQEQDREQEQEQDLVGAAETTAAASKPKSVKRSTRIPVGLVLTPEWLAAAKECGLSEPVAKIEFPKFSDHHTAKGSIMADWLAAWRTWCRKSVDFAAKGRSGASRQPSAPGPLWRSD